MKTQSNYQLPLLQKENGGTQFIAFNERIVKMSAQDEVQQQTDVYEYDSVRTPIGADYPTLVSAIIRSRYTEDQVEAIILNRGDGNPQHETEYADLQLWRSDAKTLAKKIIAEY